MLGVLALNCYLFAIDAPHEYNVLESITVSTGTKTTKLLENSPIKMQVISSQEIEAQHLKSVDEALEYIPSLMIKETIKQGSGVWIQGINSDKVLVLLNGEPMTSSIGSTTDLSQLNTGDIEKIEIIKGAASALHGSQAMGGVINIITKEPKVGFSHSVISEVGSYGNKGADNIGSSLLQANSSYKEDNFSYGVNFGYRYDGGVSLKENESYDLPELKKINFNASFNFLGDINWYIKPRFYSEKTVRAYSEFSPGIGYIQKEKQEDAKKYRLGVGGDTTINEDTLKVSAFYEYYDDDSIIDNIPTVYIDQLRKAKMNLYQGEIQYDKVLLEDHLITIGLNLKKETLEQTNIKTSSSGVTTETEIDSDAQRDATEFFAQDDWFISDSLEFIPGIRYQEDSDFGSHISPKLSLMYIPYNKNEQKINIRASFGNGYKVPTLKERFYFFDHSTIGYQVLGNPDLQPEESSSFQLSTEWVDRINQYSISLNLYRNDIKNLIEELKDDDLSSPGLEIYRYTNLSKAFTQGAEIEYNIDFSDYFNLKGGYNYLIAKDKETKKYLTSRPKHQFKAVLNTNYSDYTSVISFIYESEEFADSDNRYKSPAKTKINLALTKHVTKLFDIYGGINNLLNEYTNVDEQYDNRTKKPRYVYSGIKYKF